MASVHNQLEILAAPLKAEIEEQTGTSCSIRLRSRRGWPAPAPTYEVMVRANEIVGHATGLDPESVLLSAFQQVFDRLLPVPHLQAAPTLRQVC